MTVTSVGGAAVAQAGNATVVVTGTDKDPTIVVATRRGVATLSPRTRQGTAVRGGQLQTLTADTTAAEKLREVAAQIRSEPNRGNRAELVRQAAALVRGREGGVVSQNVGCVGGDFSVNAGDVSLGFQIRDESALGKLFRPLLGDWTSAFASATPLRGVDITFNGESGRTTVALSELGPRGRPAQVSLRDRSEVPPIAPEFQLRADGKVTALDGLLVYGNASGEAVVGSDGLNTKSAVITGDSFREFHLRTNAQQVSFHRDRDEDERLRDQLQQVQRRQRRDPKEDSQPTNG